MKPKFIILFVVLVGGAVGIGYYYKPHRNPDNEPAIAIAATDLFNQFVANEEAANIRYLDKVLVVTGNVKTISRNQQQVLVITLETGDDFFGVQCTLTPDAPEVNRTNPVTIRGICKGFLSDVVLTDATVATATQ